MKLVLQYDLQNKVRNIINIFEIDSNKCFCNKLILLTCNVESLNLSIYNNFNLQNL